jgi:hypothetical protein
MERGMPEALEAPPGVSGVLGLTMRTRKMRNEALRVNEPPRFGKI